MISFSSRSSVSGTGLAIAVGCFCCFGCFGFSGCLPKSENSIVLYCALDREFSEPILDDFTNETGIQVLAKYDVESNKTVGLANEIILQRDRQRCDLFWNNEILHTLRLQQQGLLRAHISGERAIYPSDYRSVDGQWYGFAARARVLLVNTELLPDREQWPDSVSALAEPHWQGKCAIAKPFFGTTATHAAVLYETLGGEQGDALFERIAATAVVEAGNKQVAINVSRGRYCFGLTDTDDAIIEIEHGEPVAIIFPDQGDGQTGTLLIPNTLCLPSGLNNPHAERLVDYLLSAKTEARLAAGRSAQIPLRTDAVDRARVEPQSLKKMPVDFEAAAQAWDDHKRRLLKFFPL